MKIFALYMVLIVSLINQLKQYTMNKLDTIQKVKQAFRNHNSIYIEHAKDPQAILNYLYRLERLEIVYPCMENKEFCISIYRLNYEMKPGLNINFNN
jgi:hypothetical protein